MKTIAKAVSVLCLGSLLCLAETWSGKVVDAACKDQAAAAPAPAPAPAPEAQPSSPVANACEPTASTVAFGIELPDGKVLKLDSAGNTKAAEAMKNNATFAEWLIHSTQRNYSDCAALKSETVPDAERQAASLKTKAEVSKALKDSFAYCADALQTMDNQKAISSDAVSNALLHLVVHNNEIYGNIVGYLRVSGIVPPSTAARGNQKGKKN
jgi:hypothetical protein